MWRYLLYLEPKGNTLYESGAVHKLLDRRLIAWVWLADITYVSIIICIIALAFVPLNFQQPTYQVFFTSVFACFASMLLVVLLAVAMSSMAFTLSDKVKESLSVTLLTRETLFEALWGTLTQQWPFRGFMVAGVVISVGGWLVSDVLWVGLQRETWLLLAYPVMLLVQLSLIANVTMLLSILASTGRSSLSAANAVGVLIAGAMIIGIGATRLGALRAAFRAWNGVGRQSGPSLTSVRTATISDYFYEQAIMVSINEAILTLVLMLVALIGFYVVFANPRRNANQ